jgi:hypothetical protein
MDPIAALLTLLPLTLTAPIMSIPPTESSPLPSTPTPPRLRLHARLHARQTRIACPTFDRLILHPPITLAPTPTLPPLDLTPTQTIPPIPGILMTPCQTTTPPTPTLTPTPLRVLAPTAPYSTVLSLAPARPLSHLVALNLNLGPRASQGSAQSP